MQGILQIAEQVQRQLQIPRQIFFTELPCNAGHLLALRGRGGDQARIAFGDFRDQEVADVAGQFAREMLHAATVALQFIHQGQHGRAILPAQGFAHLRHCVQRERAQQRPHRARFQLVAAAGNGLVERRKRIAHRTFTRLRDDSERLFVGLNAFLIADFLHASDQAVELH